MSARNLGGFSCLFYLCILLDGLSHGLPLVLGGEGHGGGGLGRRLGLGHRLG